MAQPRNRDPGSEDPPTRGRGQPRIGERIQVTLSDAHRATAERLGQGRGIAAGIRRALDLAAAFMTPSTTTKAPKDR